MLGDASRSPSDSMKALLLLFVSLNGGANATRRQAQVNEIMSVRRKKEIENVREVNENRKLQRKARRTRK